MFTGNGTTSKIEGKGKVILKLTSGKDLVLSNVLHVPNITKNLNSGPILSNKGFKLVSESDKFVITKGGAPHSLWGEACLAENTILNKIPYKKSDKSPYQSWKGK
ncbi:hypothetical protein Tco_0785575 [Tanacetum coccineum]